MTAVAFSVLTLVPGRSGGSETYVRGLLEQFAAGNGPERVVVFANDLAAAAYAPLEGDRIEVRRARAFRTAESGAGRFAAMLEAAALPRRLARELPQDVEVLHLPVTVPLPRATGLPTIVTLHDLQHRDLNHLFSPAERAFRRLAYDGAARGADVVVTPSEYSRDRAVELLALDSARVVAVHLGIDHERFRPGPVDRDAALLAGLDLPDEFVVYPANLWPHKNHERLLEALAGAQTAAALVLTGETYGRLDRLRALARRLGLDRRVRHLGFLPRDVMPALLRTARAMVFPSLYEGFGSPPIEAMASGCPVACSMRGALAEVCGEAALAFDPNDPREVAEAIDAVTADEPLRRRLIPLGIERARGFTWERAAARHRELYERAAAGRSGS